MALLKTTASGVLAIFPCSRMKVDSARKLAVPLLDELFKQARSLYYST